MLITTTRNIATISSAGGAYIAHVIRVPDEGQTNYSYSYVVGLSYSTGEPIGLVIQSTKVSLRRWTRVTGVEEYLSILDGSLISFTVIPADGPLSSPKDAFVSQFKLNQPVTDEELEKERVALLAALSPKRQGDDGSPHNTADA